MPKTLTFELADEVYVALQQMSARTGRPFEDLALEFLAKFRLKPKPKMREDESKAAMERLMRHAGAADLGYPTGIDNEGIDADLVREYGSTHEEQYRDTPEKT